VCSSDLSKAGRDALVKMYERYATTAMKGSGLKNKFAIIQGEIESGNNAPQLIRDARKMLKEMVQQKMVTLYEAQTHLKYLRKLNKI
jgi:predicted kinase